MAKFRSAACALLLFTSLVVVGEPLMLAMTNDGRALVFSWPSWATDAVLETSPLLANSGWNLVSRDFYQSNSTSFSYRVSAFDGTRVFRIRRLGPAVQGLTGHWGMDEGEGVIASDQSGSASRLQVTNAVWSKGRLGAALSFNGQPPSAGGTLAWVENASHQVLPPDGRPFSVSLWFKPHGAPPGAQVLVANEADGARGWSVTLNNDGPGTNHLVLSSAAGGAATVTGRVMLVPQQYYQLTLTAEGETGKLYLDSILLAEGPLLLTNSQRPLYVGGLPGGAGGFIGLVDEVRAFTNALSLDQISTRGEWRFDEGRGGLAFDSSIQGLVASVSATNAWAPGKTGHAIDPSLGLVTFSNQDYRLLPASGGEFSVSMWVKPHVPLYGRNGLFSCEAGTNGGWQLLAHGEASGRSSLEFSSTNSGGTLIMRAPASLLDGVWTKIDLTYNGAVGSLYVNSVKVASESGAIRGCEAPLVLGTVPGSAAFDGVIDNFVISSHAKSDSEIGPVALPLWEMALVNTSTNLVLPGSGPAGKPLTFSILSAPALGTLESLPHSPRITYRAGDKRGPDTFVYTVSDGEFTSPPATGAVSVVQPHWISPAGGPTQPREGRDPSRAFAGGTAAQLDAIWRTNNYYDCFFYAPGEYHTTGWKFRARQTANPGCKHIGSGSEGPQATTVRLVDTWSSHGEGVIFGVDYNVYADGFEVHNMLLDCNATNNPKITVGEPVWLRIPLTTGWVEDVTLQWSDANLVGNGVWKIARPAEFTVCSRTTSDGTYTTNCNSLASTGRTDVVRVGASTDELLIKLTRRGGGADFYGLESVEVLGTPVSLPTATGAGGAISQLDAQQSMLMATDGDNSSAWTSGAEPQVQITIPLEPGTVINHAELQWNCRTLPDLRRLGPAAQFSISARDPATGQLRDVPFVSSGRSATGLQTVTFGTTGSTNNVTTDQLVILLANREAGVDFYSLSELKLTKGSRIVPLRLPRAGTVTSLLNAFDSNPQTRWMSGSQGAVTAVDTRGNNLKFTKLKVIGFGTTAQRECFPLAVFVAAYTPKPPGGSVRNILVEDCVFLQPAPRNPDGVSAVALAGEGETMVNAVVRRCSVIGIASHFTYSHGFVSHTVENSFVDDCQVGVYFEPEAGNIESMGRVMIRSNLFMNVDMGVQVYFQPGAKFDTLICEDNEIVLKGRGGYGIGACDTCSSGVPGTITNLTALNNVIRYPEWTPRAEGTETGLAYTDIQHAVYANNLVTLGTSNPLSVRPYPLGVIPGKKIKESCDSPGLAEAPPAAIPPLLDPLLPGYRRAWYNNRDLSGSLVPVSHRVMGVNREATQQQWGE